MQCSVVMCWFKSFLVLLVLKIATSQEPCELRNGKEGECVHLRSCPTAVQLFRRRSSPEICRYENRGPVVCCPRAERNQRIVVPGGIAQKVCQRFYPRRIVSRFWGYAMAMGLIGGVSAVPQEFPHMAALGFGDERNIRWACGGSLISEKFVLTAAHCLSSQNLGDVKFVRLGDLDLNSDEDNADPQEFTVLRRIRHPDFKPPSQYHDIGLIELDREARFTQYVKPACLNSERYDYDNYLSATGWGSSEFGGNNADQLQKIELFVADYEECKRSFADVSERRLAHGVVDDWQICAGGDNKDTCQGDSGGPLQVRNQEYRLGYTIVGITSFGKSCGIANSPGVYTRVSNYIAWIEEVVWPN